MSWNSKDDDDESKLGQTRHQTTNNKVTQQKRVNELFYIIIEINRLKVQQLLYWPFCCVFCRFLYSIIETKVSIINETKVLYNIFDFKNYVSFIL